MTNRTPGPVAGFRQKWMPPGPGLQPGLGGGSRALLRWLKTLFVLIAGAQTLTGGFKATPYNLGTISSGTTTPDAANGNFQYAGGNGASTLAPPVAACSICIEWLNGASAGSITTSGFTKVTGDPITTTNGHKFFFFITKHQNYSHLHVQALQ